MDKPIVVSVNYIPEYLKPDYIYMSNVRRYNYWKNNESFVNSKKILVSNIVTEADDIVISFGRLIKCGWECMDNSSVMLLRLLDQLEVKTIAIAGMDGYSVDNRGKENYADKFLELSNVKNNPVAINRDISDMLTDFMETRVSHASIEFITDSKFSYIAETF